ncbi:hypothetical protein WJX77_008933 [Trebouxia sp. C0004]
MATEGRRIVSMFIYVSTLCLATVAAAGRGSQGEGPDCGGMGVFKHQRALKQDIAECMYINATINNQAFAACPKSTGSYTYCYADGPKGACVPTDDPVTHNIASPPCKYLLPLPPDAINGVCGIIVNGTK